MISQHRVLPGIALAAVLLFVVLVWPTPYRYSSLGSVPVRWNRVTGVVESLSTRGWESEAETRKRAERQAELAAKQFEDDKGKLAPAVIQETGTTTTQETMRPPLTPRTRQETEDIEAFEKASPEARRIILLRLVKTVRECEGKRGKS